MLAQVRVEEIECELLGLNAPFAENQAIGVSHAFSSEATFGLYWAVETVPGDPAGAFLTGVVFDDVNQDGRYDVGEGLAGKSTLDRLELSKAGAEPVGIGVRAGGRKPAVPAAETVRNAVSTWRDAPMRPPHQHG